MNDQFDNERADKDIAAKLFPEEQFEKAVRELYDLGEDRGEIRGRVDSIIDAIGAEAVRDFWQNRDAWDDDRPQDTRTGRYLEDLPDEEDDQTFKDPGRPSDRRNQTPATDEAIRRATER